jgi:hypothetical protein
VAVAVSVVVVVTMSVGMYDCNVDKLDAASTRARRCNCRCSRRPGRIGAVTLPIIARVDSCETLEIRAIRAARRLPRFPPCLR